jgi:hypothetical protein
MVTVNSALQRNSLIRSNAEGAEGVAEEAEEAGKQSATDEYRCMR